MLGLLGRTLGDTLGAAGLTETTGLTDTTGEMLGDKDEGRRLAGTLGEIDTTTEGDTDTGRIDGLMETVGEMLTGGTLGETDVNGDALDGRKLGEIDGVIESGTLGETLGLKTGLDTADEDDELGPIMSISVSRPDPGLDDRETGEALGTNDGDTLGTLDKELDELPRKQPMPPTHAPMIEKTPHCTRTGEELDEGTTLDDELPAGTPAPPNHAPVIEKNPQEAATGDVLTAEDGMADEGRSEEGLADDGDETGEGLFSV